MQEAAPCEAHPAKRNALTRTVNALCAPCCAAYMAGVTLASLFVVDIAVGSVALLWKTLKLPRRSLIRFQSFVLRRWMSVFIGHFELFSRITLKVSGDTFRRGESAIVICNHRSWMDTVILYSLARQVELHGDVKFFAKKSLLMVPVYGIAGVVLDVVVFITREIGRAGHRLERTFAALADPGRQWPYWMISYLEGTRRTREKLEEAKLFAKKRDLKLLNHVLQPRTKGFVSSVHALRGSATAIYDITLGYNETDTAERHITPSFVECLLTSDMKPRVVHVHQRRIPMESVPSSDEELKAWLYALYEEKDLLLDKFKQHRRFPEPDIKWSRMSASFYGTTLLLFWSLFIFLIGFMSRIFYALFGTCIST